MALTLLVMSSCHKESGCKQPYSPEEIPELVTDSYNTCEAVVRNYTFRFCGSDFGPYPQKSHEGDTIKVCGYIHKNHLVSGNSYIPLYDGDPDGADLSVYVLSGELSDTIDYSKKCYVEGLLYFNSLHTNGKSYLVKPEILTMEFCFE